MVIRLMISVDLEILTFQDMTKVSYPRAGCHDLEVDYVIFDLCGL